MAWAKKAHVLVLASQSGVNGTVAICVTFNDL